MIFFMTQLREKSIPHDRLHIENDITAYNLLPGYLSCGPVLFGEYHDIIRGNKAIDSITAS